MALTEESKSAERAREAGARAATPARRKPTEVPSWAAQVKPAQRWHCTAQASSLSRLAPVNGHTNRHPQVAVGLSGLCRFTANQGGTAGM